MSDYLHRAARLARVLSNPEGLKAVVTWPRFSLTSFEMVSALKKQGVLPATVIDVGANEGQFTVAAARTFEKAHVYSFEPVPKCANALRQAVKGSPNIAIYPVAIGEREGEAEFHPNTDSRSGSLLELGNEHRRRFPHAEQLSPMRVPITTLDKCLESVELRRPILLKVDVQGYEMSVLKGAQHILSCTEWVVLETSFKQMYEGELLFPEILSALDRLGFRFERPIGWLTDSGSGEVVQMDALFRRQ